MEHLVFYRLLLVLTGTSACSRVGSDSQTFSDDSKFLNRKGLFLNLGAPSQCQGTVTAWHLRYELDDCRSRSRSSTIDRETVNSVLAVYRPVNNLTMEYEIVPGSTKSVMLACDDDDNDDRTRSDARDEEEMILLEAEERFVIRRGDVIAVCLPSIKKRYRLQILEDVRNGIDIYEYIRKKSVVNGCNFNKLQTIRSQSLRARSSYRLHLHAEIAGTSPKLATTTSNSVDTSTDNSLLLNNTQMLSDNQEFLKLVTAPTASVGGLLVLIAAVLLVAGIVVCWRRRYKQRISTSSPATNGNEIRDTDQRFPFTQSRSRGAHATVTLNVFDIKENVAYQAYNFDEHVYAQPHAHQLKTHGDRYYE